MLLAGNIASIQGASRLSQIMIKAIKGNRGPTQDYSRFPFYDFLTGKKHTQDRLDLLVNKAKNRELISQADINEYQKSAKTTGNYILNQADKKSGHTLLYYVAKNDSKCRRLFNNLISHGARFNNRDKSVMGPELCLKKLLNISFDASEKQFQKILRTFQTKNTPKKLAAKLRTGKITKKQFDAQCNKFADIDHAVQKKYYNE